MNVNVTIAHNFEIINPCISFWWMWMSQLYIILKFSIWLYILMNVNVTITHHFEIINLCISLWWMWMSQLHIFLKLSIWVFHFNECECHNYTWFWNYPSVDSILMNVNVTITHNFEIINLCISFWWMWMSQLHIILKSSIRVFHFDEYKCHNYPSFWN